MSRLLSWNTVHLSRGQMMSTATAACREIGHCDTGNAVTTEGFRSNAKYIIHAVGPKWCNDNHDGRVQLYYAYTNSLIRAKEKHCKSIVFPVISAGIYGCPFDISIQEAARAINKFFLENQTYELKIIFAIPDKGKAEKAEMLFRKEFTGTSIETKAEGEYVFFWHEDEINGFMSQWYPSPFTVDGIVSLL